MYTYNKKFELNVEDIEHIEQALRMACDQMDYEKTKEIQKLLGKIHNQKWWYRPKNQTYVSG
jgi:hypothetical protein